LPGARPAAANVATPFIHPRSRSLRSRRSTAPNRSRPRRRSCSCNNADWGYVDLTELEALYQPSHVETDERDRPTRILPRLLVERDLGWKPLASGGTITGSSSHTINSPPVIDRSHPTTTAIGTTIRATIRTSKTDLDQPSSTSKIEYGTQLHSPSVTVSRRGPTPGANQVRSVAVSRAMRRTSPSRGVVGPVNPGWSRVSGRGKGIGQGRRRGLDQSE
jgi:hypothetical protein